MPITSTDLLAKLTAAVMADAALSEQVRAYEEDTFESFLGWLRTEGIEVVIHGKYGPPIRSYLFMGSHGTHLYHRPWFEYPALSLNADGFVRQALNESRVQITLAAIKLQRWVRNIQEGDKNVATATKPSGNLVGREQPPPPPPPTGATKSLGFSAVKDGGERVTERLSLHQRRTSGGTHPLTGLKLKIPDA